MIFETTSFSEMWWASDLHNESSPSPSFSLAAPRLGDFKGWTTRCSRPFLGTETESPTHLASCSCQRRPKVSTKSKSSQIRRIWAPNVLEKMPRRQVVYKHLWKMPPVLENHIYKSSSNDLIYLIYLKKSRNTNGLAFDHWSLLSAHYPPLQNPSGRAPQRFSASSASRRRRSWLEWDVSHIPNPLRELGKIIVLNHLLGKIMRYVGNRNILLLRIF